jgi:hypothetical protein
MFRARSRDAVGQLGCTEGIRQLRRIRPESLTASRLKVEEPAHTAVTCALRARRQPRGRRRCAEKRPDWVRARPVTVDFPQAAATVSIPLSPAADVPVSLTPCLRVALTRRKCNCGETETSGVGGGGGDPT